MLVKRKLQIFVSNKKRHFHAANLRLKPILLFYCASLNHNVQLIAPIYFSLCMKQGMGLLENSLYRQFVQHNNVLLKNIEIFHLYELDGISSNIMKQWEGMIELLGSESKPVGGLEFLHKYKDFKESLQKVSGGKSTELARQVVGSLMLLPTPCDKHPSTWENHPQKLVVKDNTLTSLSSMDDHAL
ncbi:nuclear pore complex protein NUP85-like isoform X4 [Vigna unguiculata]|uniref:nuclear pore complex protein NUP85-like isoform X4 n=1 Tax=Vigna unguiculata TaxID=3917 RepID=UPI0010164C9F|nr:nuclear pore complex protein NUP85-like isoform X4 [Vigna unguiculata]